ncbi:MAG: hypothetical protein AABX79_02940 [Nanoarchaeota archaeon]
MERKMLIGMIILIASFIIILLLIFRLNLGGTTDAEICRNSLVLRDKPLGDFVSSIDCKTSYLCVSGGGDCEVTASEKFVVDPKNKEEIMKILADEMSSCWWQFGEGKIDFRANPREGGTAITCAVCSLVNFKDIPQEEETISYAEFYNYLRTTQKIKSQTYLQYLYSENNLDFLSEDYLNNNLELNKQYFILTAITKDSIWSYTPFVRLYINPDYQPPIILEQNKDNYDQLKCDEFVNKA